jgi:Rieske Fe-S protein
MPSSEEQPATSQKCEECPASRHLSRRVVLKSALSIGLGLQLVTLATADTEDPKKSRPQVGDFFVFSLGERQGQIITPQDVPLGGPPVVAYPVEEKTHAVRDGSRLNQVLLLYFPPEEFSEQTRAATAGGIVGYSAVCTHTGCNVAGWKEETKQLLCPCHASTFDPKDRAKVVSGPAPRPLAMLPLQIVDGKLVVAGAFSGRVGAEQK